MRLNYSDIFVAIAAVDLASIVQFYEAIFSTPPAIYQGDRYAEFHLPNLRLGLFKPSINHEVEFPCQSSSISLCVEVINLDEAIQHLQTLNVPTPKDINKASHGREIYVYDPLGNRLILHESSHS